MFTHENPKKESQLINIFKNLFGDKKIETEVISNTAENAETLKKANYAQQNFVIGGGDNFSLKEAFERLGWK